MAIHLFDVLVNWWLIRMNLYSFVCFHMIYLHPSGGLFLGVGLGEDLYAYFLKILYFHGHNRYIATLLVSTPAPLLPTYSQGKT